MTDPLGDGSKVWTDFAAQCVMRLHPSGAVEVAQMEKRAGQAFLIGKFQDGKESVSELPSLLLEQKEVKKRPASAMVADDPGDSSEGVSSGSEGESCATKNLLLQAALR